MDNFLQNYPQSQAMDMWKTFLMPIARLQCHHKVFHIPTAQQQQQNKIFKSYFLKISSFLNLKQQA